jgi:hypothetical protein
MFSLKVGHTKPREVPRRYPLQSREGKWLVWN